MSVWPVLHQSPGHLRAWCVLLSGAWLPLLCIMNCTAVAEEARQASGLSREEITRLAAEVSAGCGGVNFLPYLTGERTPNWPVRCKVGHARHS